VDESEPKELLLAQGEEGIDIAPEYWLWVLIIKLRWANLPKSLALVQGVFQRL
jgi:hypothetical protein